MSKTEICAPCLRLLPFVLALANPVVGEETAHALMERSMARLKKIAGTASLPAFEYLGVPGFAALRDISIAPLPAVSAATCGFLSRVADNLKAPLRDRFIEIFRTEGKFIPDFMHIVRRTLARNGFGSDLGNARDSGYVAYAVYENDASVREMIGADSAVEALSRVMGEYSGRYREMILFFLREPWCEGRSIVDMVRAYWGSVFEFSGVDVEVVPLGFPDAYYRASWAERVIELYKPMNGKGKDIMSRFPSDTLKRCAASATLDANMEVRAQTFTYHIVSWNRLRETGFFRSRHCIQMDAGVPIMGIAEMLVHELMHHAYYLLTSYGFRAAPNALCRFDSPFRSEGFAEYHTERCLERVFERYPELEYFRLVRRAMHYAEDRMDSHIIGLALMENLPDPDKWGDAYETSYDTVHVTPEFELSFAMHSSGIEPFVTRVAVPSPEFMKDVVGR